MRVRSFPRFVRDGFIRLRRTAAVPGVLAPAGLVLVLLWSLFGHCDPRTLLAATGFLVAAIGCRLWDLRDATKGKCASLRLSLIALVLPRADAILFLEEYGAMCRGRRGCWGPVANGLVSTVTATWRGWLRVQLLRAFLPALRVRLVRIDAVLEQTPAVLACTEAELETVRRCWRQLRWLGGVVRWLTGSWQYQNLGQPAEKLAKWCSELERRVVSRSVRSNDEGARLEVVGLRVRELTKRLIAVAADWSPYTSDGSN